MYITNASIVIIIVIMKCIYFYYYYCRMCQVREVELARLNNQYVRRFSPAVYHTIQNTKKVQWDIQNKQMYMSSYVLYTFAHLHIRPEMDTWLLIIIIIYWTESPDLSMSDTCSNVCACTETDTWNQNWNKIVVDRINVLLCVIGLCSTEPRILL